jgi:hypothetical protein
VIYRTQANAAWLDNTAFSEARRSTLPQPDRPASLAARHRRKGHAIKHGAGHVASFHLDVEELGICRDRRGGRVVRSEEVLMKAGEFILLIVVLGFLFVLLPKIISQLQVTNAALNAQYSPAGAWNRVQAGLINSAGNVGIGLINASGNDLTGAIFGG